MKMKSRLINLLIFTLVISSVTIGLAQNVGINDDNSAPNAKAMLDIKSTTKGVILPRMTTVQRTGMSLNLTNTAMIVYDTDLDNYFYWDGMEWEYFGGSYWMSNSTGIYSFPTDKNVGIGNTANSTRKLYVYSEDLAYGLFVSAHNDNNSSVIGQAITVNSTVNATRRGIDINMPSSGGVGLKEGIRSVIHLSAGQTADVSGFKSIINGSTSSGDIYGVNSAVNPGSSTGNHYGLYGKAIGANGYGVYGESTFGFGGFFDGKVAITENIGIGQSDIDPNVALDINNTTNFTNINSLNDYDGSGPQWGIYNIVSDQGTGQKIGNFTRVASNSGS